MPIYHFKCLKCQHILEELLNDKSEVVNCPECQEAMKRIPACPANPIITRKSVTTGKNVKVGIDKELKERSKQHFIKHKATELVSEHGIQTAENLGWINKDGTKKTTIDAK